jgi:hypothetical protein
MASTWPAPNYKNAARSWTRGSVGPGGDWLVIVSK